MIEQLRYRGKKNTDFQNGQEYAVEVHVTQTDCIVKLPGQNEYRYSSLAEFFKNWQMPVHKAPLPAVDPHKIYIQAEAFEAAAIDMNVKINTEKKILLLVPSIVNAAFAFELYLKCLITSQGKEPWGHDIESLFYSLLFQFKKK